MAHKKVTILIPAYNESEVLTQLHDRLTVLIGRLDDYDVNILFVNDGSTDNTMDLIRQFAHDDSHVEYVNLSRNYGKEIAMIAGLDNAKEADAVIIIDADLQDPPELIPEMIKYWREGYDDVYAKRRSRAGESWLKKKTSEWFYKILQKSTRIEIQRDTGDFRLLDKRCVEAITQLRESQRYTKGMFSWIGYSKKEILYDRDPRAAGTTKWNYWKLIDLAIEGITSFTTFPLRIASILGMVVSLCSLIYLIILVMRTIFVGSDVAGYPSMMAAILFFGGVQLLSIGIIGEYIGRIFTETKNRPLYYVDKIHKSHEK
jgi:glycosyltransferase involved in cell wall biosynthesis